MDVVVLTTLTMLAKIAAMSDWRHGSYVIGIFDWQTGMLRFRMVKQGVFGGPLIKDTREATENVHQAYRWHSRQAARQALRMLQRDHSFGVAWEVVNLKRMGTH